MADAKESAVEMLGLGTVQNLDTFDLAMNSLSTEYPRGAMKFRLILLDSVRRGSDKHAEVIRDTLSKCDGDHEKFARVMSKAVRNLDGT